MMKRTTTAVALALVLASGTAFADDSSMSRLTGDSFKAFEAARTHASASVAAAPKSFTAIPDDSTSRWNGDSYVAFEQARKTASGAATGIAEANKARASAMREKPVVAARGRKVASPFRDDTA
ncbi:MAG TPA: hypothetical protein VGI14_22045 [Casimicrobiaceae bacterium]